MNLQKSENPASASVFHLNADPEAHPGGRWTDRQLSFGLQARDALHLTYVFYEWEAEAYPGFMGEPWLHIRLNHQSFCFGNWWGWKIQFDPGCNLPKRLAYAIQVEKMKISQIGYSIHSADFVREEKSLCVSLGRVKKWVLTL